MIQLYDSTEIDYESNGTAVLHPTSCVITEEAGGNYMLSLSHPFDHYGAWKSLQVGAIIKAPVPTQMTERTLRADHINVWKVSTNTELRAKPSTPVRIDYSAWVNPLTSGNYYSNGDRVTSGGSNYQCKSTPLGVSAYIEPSKATGYWTKIARYTGGGEILLTLKANTYVYYLSKPNDNWVRVMTLDGMEGYIKLSDADYDHKITGEAAKPRSIKEQLFRVYDVSVNTKQKTVTASARHVSYDLAGVLLNECVIKRQAPSTALALIKSAFTIPQDTTLSTNLSADVDGKYTQTHTHQNGISALLDPESGFLAYYRAKLIRDNWDLFLYRNEPTDRGLVLEYGVNLLGVTWSVSSDSIVTRVMPVAKKADGSELYIGNKWVNSPLIEAYPVIRMELLNVDGQVGQSDGDGGTWTTETLRDHMNEEAQKRFDVDNADKPRTEIKVDFTLLGDTAEYAQYKGLQRLCLYDTITVRDANVGLEQSLQVTKYTWDAILEHYTGITLGTVFDYSMRTIAGYEISNGTIQFEKLSPDAITKIKEAR